MKTALKNFARVACLALALGGAREAAVSAQQSQPPSAAQSRVRVQMKTLDSLADRAETAVDVTADENLLGVVKAMFAGSKDPEAAKVREALAGLEGIYVRVFGFAEAGQWAEADIADIRRQTDEAGWSRIVNVRNKKDGRKVEVFLRALSGKIGGLLVLATEPKQLVIVNMVGDVDVQKLTSLQGQFGIPDIDIKGDRDDDDDKATKRETKPAAKKP